MSMEELDRVAATLPEWEGSPSPACVVPDSRIENATPHREEPAVPVTHNSGYLLLVLSGSLLAGLAVAWFVDRWMGCHE